MTATRDFSGPRGQLSRLINFTGSLNALYKLRSTELIPTLKASSEGSPNARNKSYTLLI